MMDYNEFIMRAESEGLSIQAEEIAPGQWHLNAVDEDGVISARLPVSQEVIRELQGADRLTRSWEFE
jgi:hypothetical protein